MKKLETKLIKAGVDAAMRSETINFIRCSFLDEDLQLEVILIDQLEYLWFRKFYRFDPMASSSRNTQDVLQQLRLDLRAFDPYWDIGRRFCGVAWYGNFEPNSQLLNQVRVPNDLEKFKENFIQKLDLMLCD